MTLVSTDTIIIHTAQIFKSGWFDIMRDNREAEFGIRR